MYGAVNGTERDASQDHEDAQVVALVRSLHQTDILLSLGLALAPAWLH